MTSSRVILLILITGLTNCSSQQDKKVAGADTTNAVTKIAQVNDLQQSNHLTDSIKSFKVDDYPVTAAMLKCTDQSSACPISYKDLSFKLGDPKKKIISTYGKPDGIKIKNGIEEYEWNFIGELLYDGKQNLKGKPLAKDNYGHQINMYFSNNKLTAVILHNDIP